VRTPEAGPPHLGPDSARRAEQRALKPDVPAAGRKAEPLGVGVARDQLHPPQSPQGRPEPEPFVPLAQEWRKRTMEALAKIRAEATDPEALDLVSEYDAGDPDARHTLPLAVARHEAANRYFALKAAYPSENDFDAAFEASRRRGRRWGAQRAQLGLGVDDVAPHAKVSSWELMFLEMGLPTAEGLSDEVEARIDAFLRSKQPPDPIS
jgi:hypothetical protein